jgi:hypothetical protein
MVACLFAFVDSAIAQAQMLLLDGQILTNKIAKVIFVTALTFGILLRPKVNISGVPVVAWLVALSYLLFEIVYMQAARDISPGDILQTYNAIYAYLLLSPAALAFHDTVPERFVIRGIVCAFVICAIIGTAQYLTLDPLLHLCDIDEDYTVQSVWFFDQIRAFSLFSSPLNYGIFCSFCGALGIGLSREKRVQGVLLATLSAAACYTYPKLLFDFFCGEHLCSGYYFRQKPKTRFGATDSVFYAGCSGNNLRRALI